MDDEERYTALREALRQAAEADRKSGEADSDDDREAARREREAWKQVALAVTADDQASLDPDEDRE